MFLINDDDMSIYLTRGDTALFQVSAMKSETEKYVFKAGDVVRIKVFEKKACENVVLQKEFGIEEDTEMATIYLSEKDTRFGEVISKPKDYWYEIELNPYTEPQTIVGYDEDGAKVLKLFPEGADMEDVEIEEEDIPIVDAELDQTSKRPIQNQAVAKAITELNYSVKVATKKAEEVHQLVEKVPDKATFTNGRITVYKKAEEEGKADKELFSVEIPADEVTEQSVKSALGYTPASEDMVAVERERINQLLSGSATIENEVYKEWVLYEEGENKVTAYSNGLFCVIDVNVILNASGSISVNEEILADKELFEAWTNIGFLQEQTTGVNEGKAILNYVNGEENDSLSLSLVNLTTKSIAMLCQLSYPLKTTTFALPELNDARIGTDGTVYGSLGESIRGQISKTVSAFDKRTSITLIDVETAQEYKLKVVNGKLTMEGVEL